MGTNNYASLHEGKLLFRLTHLYSVGEHSVLSKPAEVDLSGLFGSGYNIVDAVEMSAAGSRTKEDVESCKYDWKTDSEDFPAGKWMPTADPKVTIRPMEVKTFLVAFTKDTLV